MSPALVLVVEDDHDVRQAICESLLDHGFETAAVHNGKEALAWLRRSARRPALIVLDMMMPEMDGWEFRREQRRDPELAAIPVVVLTAHARVDPTLGNAFLRKPVRLQELIATIEQLRL